MIKQDKDSTKLFEGNVSKTTIQKSENNKKSRRDFLILASSAMGGVGIAGATWTLIDSMNPAADVLAVASVDVNLAPVKEGQAITVMWQGKPIFIRRRTPDEIKAAVNVDMRELVDPQADKDRVQKPEWLVVIGVCTHLGCVPSGQKVSDNRGHFGGWFCPCHGSEYDTSGRIRKGPAPKNLEVPHYRFLDDHSIRIGEEAV